MDITKLLKEQEAWLKKTQEALTDGGLGEKDVELATEFKQQRLEELKARIDRLANEKEAVAKRYDTAIEEEKAEMARLQRHTTKPAESGRTEPARPVAAAPAKRTAKEAAKTTSAAARRRPAASPKARGKSTKG